MALSKNYKISFALITVLFFFLGFITVLVDSLIPRLRELFDLSYFEAGTVQFAFFSAYFALSIPSSYFLTKIGYKGGIITGLLVMALGCALFYPAAEYRSFGIFISGYFILAGGMTLLQVAINPFVAVLGDEKSSSSRLTLAQAFNSLGTAIAPAVGAFFILSDTIKTKAQIAGLTHSMKESYFAAEAAAVQLPFVTIAAVIALVAIVFLFAKLPKLIESNERTSYWDLLHHKNLLYGVLGIFFYVGAEVAIGSYLVNYLLDMDLVPIIKNNTFMKSIAEGILNAELMQKDQKAIVGVFVTFYWSGAMIGRFLGAYLTKKYSPGKVIGIFAFCAIALALISISTTGLIAMWSLITIGLFNSIMFPTIFSLAIGGLGVLKPKASGLLCMAIVGGALVPPMFGFLADTGGFKIALLLVVFCYAYIAFFGFRNYRMKNSIL